MVRSRLLERFMHHHLVQKPSDEVQHAGLVVGKIIFNEHEGFHGPVSPLSNSGWIQG